MSTINPVTLVLLGELSKKVDSASTKLNETIVTDGDGTSFLSNDGSYKTVITESTDLSNYPTKDEVAEEYLKTSTAKETFATKEALTEGVSNKATIAAVESLSEYVYTLPTTDILNNAVANKANKNQIITKTSGNGYEFLADDGTYKLPTGLEGKELATKEEVETLQATINSLIERIAALEASVNPTDPGN